MHTEESRNGHLHLSIEQLFRLVRHGFHTEEDLLGGTGATPSASQPRRATASSCGHGTAGCSAKTPRRC